MNDAIRLLPVPSVYDLFQYAEQKGVSIANAADEIKTDEYENYDRIVEEGRLLLPLTHPDPYHVWITGTGLTHLGSAVSRNKMHEAIQSGAALTDSIKMFRMGEKDGKMKNGVPASQPEWFYKGNGLIAVPPGQPITSPSFAMDGGEEPEIAGLYIINKNEMPVRIGFALGNEFSDHVMERINYLYLAHSKLRQCSYGPELLLDGLPGNIIGQSKIVRDGKVIWQKEFPTGETNMSHNIANLEHHHFKYKLFRQPGDVHIHFFGTSALSFSDNIKTKTGDIFEIQAEPFGRSLCNTFRIED